MWGRGAADEGNSSKEVEGEGAGAERRSRTGSESERVIETRLRWSLEVEGRQRGQTGEERERSKDLREGSLVMAG